MYKNEINVYERNKWEKIRNLCHNEQRKYSAELQNSTLLQESHFFAVS